MRFTGIWQRRDRRSSAVLAVAVTALLSLVAAFGADPASAAPVVDAVGLMPSPFAAECANAAPAQSSDCAGSTNIMLPAPTSAWHGIFFNLARSLQAAEDVSAAVVPIPLPAAGFMLLAGLGVLGLVRRRRDGAEVSLRVALRETSRVDVDGHRPVAPRLIPSAKVSHLRVDAARNLDAFSPAVSSRARPLGGAVMRYAAMAERAPPASAAEPEVKGIPTTGYRGRANCASAQPKYGCRLAFFARWSVF